MLLLLLRLLNRSLRPRSRMGSVALGWHRRLLLARMVVHVLRRVMMRGGRLNG